MEEHLISEIRKHGRADLEEEATFVRKTAIEKKARKENGEPGIKVTERPLRQRKIVEKVLRMLGYRTYLIAGFYAIVSNLLQVSNNNISLEIRKYNDSISFFVLDSSLVQFY